MHRDEQEKLTARRSIWADKLERAASGQAGGLHRLSKEADRWRPRPDQQEQGDAVCPLAAAEVARQGWGAIWKVEDPVQQQQRPWEIPSTEEPSLDDITAQEVEDACKHFKVATGVGTDAFHPRAFLLCREKARRP